jgi:hypothetical protein
MDRMHVIDENQQLQSGVLGFLHPTFRALRK